MINSRPRAFGLALAAMLAICAVTGSAAHAINALAGTNTKSEKTAYFLESKVEPTKFVGFGVAAECESTEFSGEQELPSETITTGITAWGCTTLGFPTTVVANGCNLVGHAGAEIGTEEYEGTVDIECPAGQSIEIKTWFSEAAHETSQAPACIVKVGTQTGLTGPRFKTDKGAGAVKDDVTLEGIATGITASQVRNSAFCPMGTETSEASYELVKTITYFATEDIPKPTIVDLWLK